MAEAKYQFYSDPDYLAEGFLVSDFVWERGKKTGRGRGEFTLRYWRGEFYHWHNGRYIRVSDSQMRAWIKQHLHDLNEAVPLTGTDSEQRVRITHQLVSNIMLCLAGTKDVYIPETVEVHNWVEGSGGERVLVFRNGLVDLRVKDEAGKAMLFSLDPAFFNVAQLPYDYEPDADCPLWREFLQDVMAGDAERVELLQQWAGYLLANSMKRQKFLLIAGEGGNGKTVFTTILEKMVGEDNVSHVPLSMFGHQFALAATLGRVLNSTTESSHTIDELAETMLKSYTSGDRMTFQRKYKEPVSARPTAKVMISTNQLPQFTDKSSGIWRRMLFVPFEKTYPPNMQNPNLVDELSAELGGIFNWAVEGLQKLDSANGFVGPSRCREAIDQYRRDINPARAFLLDNYTSGFEYEGLGCREVYDSYVAYCHDNGHRPLNSSNFGKEVKRTFPLVNTERRRCSGSRGRFYFGLGVREDSEVATRHVSTY